MRRIAACLLAAALLVPALLPADARAQAEPPHAWLFGTWTGGIFPVSSGVSAVACLGQPTVIFTRDVVLRATLTDATYTQRVIVTARTLPGETTFQFTAGAQANAGSGLLGLDGPPPTVGFGCEGPNVLHVQRRSENEIAFPGCADFTYPLVRCGGR